MADSQVKERESMGRAKKKPDKSTFAGKLAANLRSLREDRDMTVDKFCKKMASKGYPVAPATVYSWEIGHRIPPTESLPAIVKSLKCNYSDIIPTK